jgi:hypothetical protein
MRSFQQEQSPQIEDLRRVWREAMKTNSPGISPQEVFARLRRKYKVVDRGTRVIDDPGSVDR